MTDTTTNTAEKPGSAETVLEHIRGTRDALSVRRVFSDPQEVDGATIIAVARVSGGGGGGGGEGTQDEQSGSGFGTGFGLHASPVGIYVVRDGAVTWKPTVDVTRLARGGQMLAGLVTLCLTAVVMRYLKRHS